MPTRTDLLARLGLEHPIIQAPMAGGFTTTDLVVAVSEAGGLGCLGCAYLTGDAIRRAAAEVEERTRRPYGINLFAPYPTPELPSDVTPALEALADAHADLGLPPPAAVPATTLDFDDQLAAVLDSHAAVLSFTFGVLAADTIAEAKRRGFLVVGTATTVAEGMALEAAGVDAIVAQGSEAGAHRGTFAGSFEASMIGTMALVPQLVDAVSIPVIASGGIMDGRGVAAALVLGAQAVQLGTAFLGCPEAGTPAAHRRAIADAREDQTRITRAFSGRQARGIANRLMDAIERHPEAVLPFPLQNQLTRPVRSAAAERGRAEYLSLWAGQGLRLARSLPAAELVREIARETDVALKHARGGR